MRKGSLRVRGWIFALTLLLGSLLVNDASAQSRASYRHPAGFSLSYPGDWQIHESIEGVILLPSDAATDAMGQPLEMFMLGSDDTAGITDPTDPAVVAYFQQGLPGFRQVGRPERLDTPMGPGAILTFEGSMGGPQIRQRTYIALARGKGVFLAHLATSDVASRRDATAREIFRSFSWGEAARDPALVGHWIQEGGSVSEGYSGDYGSSSRTREYRFGPDGSARYDYESSISVDVEGLSTSGGSSDSRAGTFAAGNGVLFLRFEDGEEWEYRYELVQDGSGSIVLRLTTAEGEVLDFYRAGIP